MVKLRIPFYFESRLIYEWDQTFDEVRIYISVPPFTRASHLYILILPKLVTIGIKGNPPYLSHNLSHLILEDQSLWTLDEGVLEINLTKASPGTVWTAAFSDHLSLNSYTIQEEQVTQSLMRERFSMEHPGFDFSNAVFNGSTPNPKTFMK